MTYYRILLCNIWGIFFITSPITQAQVKNVIGIDFLDPSFRYGRLDNGFTYYIKQVKDSSKKLDMRFYVKVGSYHQQEDQLEFAHAIEHLAFKCAKHFPVNLGDDPKLYSQLGMTNNDVGASTKFLLTEYYFNVPVNNEKAIDTGFLWFHDIANLQLTAEQIQNEKGPLRQEVVLKQGDNLSEFFLKKHLVSQLFPCQLDFYNFFEHNQGFTPASLKAFYKDWYHPDRMAVVIVGDIGDMDELERKINERFSDINGHSALTSFTDCRWKYLEGPDRFAALERLPRESSLEDESEEFYLYIRDRKTLAQCESHIGVRRKVIWEMLGYLINSRLREIGMEYNPTFSGNGINPDMGFPAYRLRIRARIGKGQIGIEKTIGILQQVKKYGFTTQEWEQAKKRKLAAMKSADTKDTDYWLKQIQNHYGYGEALQKNKSITYHWLSIMTLNNFNELSKQFISDKPNDIGIIAPKGISYTEPEVRGWIEQALSNDPAPYFNPEVPEQLLPPQEKLALRMVGYSDNGKTEFGAVELVLTNGVKVVLDTSNKNSSRVYLHGFSPKGAFSFSNNDYFSAINAPSIIQNSGVGNLDKFTLKRFLEKTSFRQGVHPYIDNMETGINGDAEIQDMEKLLQLVYLYFSRPRKDRFAFEDWKFEEKNRYINPSYSLIQEDFDVAIREFLGDNSKVPQGTVRFQGIPKTSLDRAFSIYKELFGNAKDFTFLISGNFSVDKMLPLIQKYLGNLPNQGEFVSHNFHGVNHNLLSDTPLYTEFTAQEIGGTYNMKSLRYALMFTAQVDHPLDWKEHFKMFSLGILMDSKMKELRFHDKAALYHYTAWSSFNRNLSYYYFGMTLDCLPNELEHLRQLCKEMVLSVKRNSFSPERFNQTMSRTIIPRFVLKRQRTFSRLEQMYNYYRFNEEWIDASEIEGYIKSLTPNDIQLTARKYLKEKDMREFVFRDSIKQPKSVGIKGKEY